MQEIPGLSRLLEIILCQERKSSFSWSSGAHLQFQHLGNRQGNDDGLKPRLSYILRPSLKNANKKTS